MYKRQIYNKSKYSLLTRKDYDTSGNKPGIKISKGIVNEIDVYKRQGVTHTHTASGKTTRTEVYTYNYDHADRISKVQHSLGITAITLYDATYDNFGRLLTKQYQGTCTNKLTYTYNPVSYTHLLERPSRE